ncbi:MAG: 4-hydroxy-tetrahydrodipicolinate reductase [Desulfitobacteriaceae bacterium]|nr:4-hydroxy-tetrahydrodipicolinate reductase [Desulfitobacteriaceae bacterium]MDD4751785.1 4-hydroxy-tetrahydrodipicolinate reductase [Desulfitobacteriaceae bacterium]
MPEKIKIVFAGVNGKMGRAMLKGIMNEPDIVIVGAVDIESRGTDIGMLIGLSPVNIFVEDDLDRVLKNTNPDILLDFTSPASVMKNIEIAVENRVGCVVGTTGISHEELESVKQWSSQYRTPVFIAPNFAIGAVLMMRFAQEASHYFPHVEIIEKHHDQKIDAPSGTALKTMELIAEERKSMRQGSPAEVEKLTGSRGGEYQGMRVHSIRLPGYVAHQEVIFGGDGQTLVIKHDTINRDCFLPGVLLAIRNLKHLEGVVYGLEKLLW